MRKQSRELRQATRDIEKSKRELERQEKVIEAEIKKAAKLGQKQVVATYAKQLVGLRKQKTRLVTASSQIGAVSSQTKVLQANSALASAMATTAKSMSTINKTMNPAAISNTVRQFEQENTKMDMKEELMDEALAGVLDHSDDEAEQDAVVAQVLDELGLETKSKLAAAPSAATGSLSGTKATDGVTDDDLMEKLAKLKT